MLPYFLNITLFLFFYLLSSNLQLLILVYVSNPINFLQANSLNTAILVDVVASRSFLYLLLLQHVIAYLEKIIQVIQNKEVLVPIQKEFLYVREVKQSNLSQCVNCEVSLRHCKVFSGVVYGSPSQSNAKFGNFLSDLDELLGKTASANSLFTIILGDFNARSLSWQKKDKTTAEGTQFGSPYIFP